MDKEIKTRLGWVELYRETGNAGLTCRRCGISRPTLRLWTRRYEEEGIGGLRSRSRRPKHSPNQKRTPTLEEHILKLRQKRNLGARRIQSDLLWEDDIRLSLGTIHKVLVNAEVGPLKRPPRRKHCKRYERPVPGDRVQMDTCKISTGIYQYTAIDDCTRCRVLRVYPRRTAKNTLEFLDAVIEEMGFPVQRVQTDRGSEFFAYKVQERLMDYGIKFRPIRPASPHLNGKVERSQKTDKIEFYAICNLDAPGLEERPAGAPKRHTGSLAQLVRNQMRWIQSAIREGGGRSPAEEWAREKLDSDRRSRPSASCSWSNVQRKVPISGFGHEGEGVAEARIFT